MKTSCRLLGGPFEGIVVATLMEAAIASKLFNFLDRYRYCCVSFSIAMLFFPLKITPENSLLTILSIIMTSPPSNRLQLYIEYSGHYTLHCSMHHPPQNLLLVPDGRNLKL